MSANWFFLVFPFDVTKMHDKPVHKSVFCLSDILFVANSACDAINKVMAFARDVLSGTVCSVSGCAGDPATSVQQRAVVAAVGSALVFGIWRVIGPNLGLWWFFLDSCVD